MTITPRLRIERLVIVESRAPLALLRDVPLHSGLNIVWAEELAASDGGSEVHRAGHGVGKTTFSLMLRAVLGDDGAAVKTMRSHLAEHYASGGIAAEVLAGAERFAVFRSFGLPSFAMKNKTVEQLFEEESKSHSIDFSTYMASLGELACLSYLATSELPVTGQVIEWEHVLCWLARDQGLGLRQYFEWRNEDGTGLRRKAKDPPALTRLMLGILSQSESKAEADLARFSKKLESARDALRDEEQRDKNTRSIIETQLRVWAKVSPSLAMVADDLFAPSVENVVSEAIQRLEQEIEQARAQIDVIDQELIELAASIKSQTRTKELAKARWDEASALKNKDDCALKEARERRDRLLQLVGSCQYGEITYSDCSYIQKQRDTVSFSIKRDIGVLKMSVEEHEERESAEKAKHDGESKELEELTKTQWQKSDRKKKLNKNISDRQRLLGEGDSVRKTLAEWEDNQKAPETEKLRTARAEVATLERKIDSAKSAKMFAQTQVSERARSISERFSRLAQSFGANGRYVPADEKRPFQMLRADGDAYTVLEILLGDLTCAVDGVKGGGAHPGFLVFDCPREREMSPQLYDRFLRLVDEVCQDVPGLQVVLTTTTPPPGSLMEKPTRILKLSHASDDDLLLKRRIENLLTRTPVAIHDDEEPL